MINGLKRDKDVIGCSSLPAAGAANAAPPLQRRVIVAKKCPRQEREGERKKETSIIAASQQQRTFPCLGKMITANCLSRAFRSRETFAIEAKLSKPLNELRNLLLFPEGLASVQFFLICLIYRHLHLQHLTSEAHLKVFSLSWSLLCAHIQNLCLVHGGINGGFLITHRSNIKRVTMRKK